ncbi:MAG: hypothetical protein DMG27_14700 [Acidobacteria bacterium]|nr:MAG: hypothetical protein DMG27_14700 [Acidobacteriota bacterium]
MTAIPPLVALMPAPALVNVPVRLALMDAIPVTFTGNTTKSLRQLGVSLMPNVNLAGYVPGHMKAPVLMPSDSPQSTVGQFGPLHLVLPLLVGALPLTRECSGFSSRDVVAAVAGAGLSALPAGPAWRLSCWYHQRGSCCNRDNVAGSVVSG